MTRVVERKFQLETNRQHSSDQTRPRTTMGEWDRRAASPEGIAAGVLIAVMVVAAYTVAFYCKRRRATRTRAVDEKPVEDSGWFWFSNAERDDVEQSKQRECRQKKLSASRDNKKKASSLTKSTSSKTSSQRGNGASKGKQDRKPKRQKRGSQIESSESDCVFCCGAV